MIKRKPGESLTIGNKSTLTLEYIKDNKVCYFRYRSKTSNDNFRIILNAEEPIYIDGATIFLSSAKPGRVDLGIHSEDVKVWRTEVAIRMEEEQRYEC